MKVVLPGGSGHLGGVLSRALAGQGHEVVVLSRWGRPGAGGPRGVTWVAWDGRTIGPWASEIDGSDVVVNLAGRSVNCRYTPENLREMMDSRVDSARVVGQAIQQSAKPPRVWLQMSTATIYAHSFDQANDEDTGVIGGNEPDVPAYWGYSVRIAENWERALAEANTPQTRKVALRTAIAMSPDRGGAFDMLRRMARLGIGGAVAGGRQFVSWIHEDDLVAAIKFLIEHDELTGPFNLAAPGPLPQRDFMRALRAALGTPIGLPATAWMAEIGAFVLRSDTELLLKSRRVVPGRLLAEGFSFKFPEWPEAARDLVHRPRPRLA